MSAPSYFGRPEVRAWMAVLLIVAATAVLRIHLIDSPLERDEGEYAYSGQLMLQGIPPYQLAVNMKLPGTYVAYALIMGAFGQSIAAIHAGLLLANGGAIVLIYLLGRKWYSVSAGIAACAAYALLSVQAGVLGTQAHATHFVVLAALVGLWLLVRSAGAPRSGVLFASGLLFGVGFLMKQHGILFGVFGAGYLLLVSSERWPVGLRKLALFLAGAATPFGLTCLLLWRAGVFPRFWFWTFTYARRYVSENSLADGVTALAETFRPILRDSGALWALAAVGLVLASQAIWNGRKAAWFPPALLAFSLVAVCPGLYFRPHYVVLMLPAVALLAGACVRGRVSACIFAAAMILSLAVQRDFLFRMTPVEISRELYGLDPFPEAVRIAAYIREHTSADARIAVLGSEPEIYFYARRHSATPFLYIEPMVEPQPFALTMQNDMVHDLEQAAPEYVVRFPIEETLSLGPDSPTRLFDWWADYGPKHYRLVAIADILPGGHTEYRWDGSAEAYRPQSLYHLAVYRRR